MPQPVFDALADYRRYHPEEMQDPVLKRRIREAAEVEEREFYNGRAPQDWLDALAPLGTDQNKPFLEVAPVLIVIFAPPDKRSRRWSRATPSTRGNNAVRSS